MVFQWFKKKFGGDAPAEEVKETAIVEVVADEAVAVEREEVETATVANVAAAEIEENPSTPAASEPQSALVEAVIVPPPPEPAPAEANIETVEPKIEAEPKVEKTSYLARLKQGLSKTRTGLADLFLGKKQLDQDLIDDLEMQLLTADVGIETTQKIINDITTQLERKALSDVDAVRERVAQHMYDLIQPFEAKEPEFNHKPHVILMIGINGAGKTTTIGKLAKRFQEQGKRVMLAAGDTFRAAAVEQLQTWGERHGVPVIAQGTGADSASVAFDALQSATAKQMDVLIIDTAGRLHTQDHLMEELKKIKRVLQRQNPDAPHETLLVLDAGNGQNALRQAEQFHKAMQLSGLVVTKLDGTAKGGILFSVTHKLGLPIRFIGVGEQAQDLRTFNAVEFVDALLYHD